MEETGEGLPITSELPPIGQASNALGIVNRGRREVLLG
jgi:hypothetical protein